MLGSGFNDISVDPDPEVKIVDPDPDPGGLNEPKKKLKNHKFNVLRCWMFSVRGRRVLLPCGLRINVPQVLKKKTVKNARFGSRSKFITTLMKNEIKFSFI